MTRFARTLLCAVAVLATSLQSAAAGPWPGTNGTIAFLNDDVIYSMEPDGSNVTPIVEGFSLILGFNLSGDGSKLTFTAVPLGEDHSALFIANADGSDVVRLATPGMMVGQGGDLSPDGTRIVFQGAANTFDLFLIDVTTQQVTRLTDDGLVEGQPMWSPDGELIAFERSSIVFGPPRPGGGPINNYDIFTIAPDGTGLKRLTTASEQDYIADWSPTGDRITWVRSSAAHDEDIWVMDRDGSNAHDLSQSPGSADQAPSFSPDGQWIVFSRGDRSTGARSIALITTDGTATTVLGIRGYDPSWQSVGATRPVRIVGTPDRVPDVNGWYRAPVTISWTVDGVAGLLADTTVTTGGSGLRVVSDPYCPTATVCFTGSVILSVDATPPIVTAVPDRQPDSSGWYRAPVTVSWSVSDPAPSGGLGSLPGSVTISADGSDQVVSSGPVCDAVGNCSSASTSISLDSHGPSVWGLTVSPSIALPGQMVSVSASAEDLLSGLALVEAYFGSDPGVGNGVPLSVSGGSVSGTLAAPSSGTQTLVVRVLDVAGNATSVSATVRVVTLTGRVGGSGAIVPRGPTSDPGDWLPGADGRAKGSFSVNVRYRSMTDRVPSGSFKFDMDGGVFSLRSESLAWLVVDPAGTAELGGLASIRGYTGLFPFAVHAVDGRPDRLRLRVWMPGDDIDRDQPLYQASGDVSGQISVTS